MAEPIPISVEDRDIVPYEDRQVRAMCGRVLAQLDRASTATGGLTDG